MSDESQGGREPHFDEKGWDQSKKERLDYTVKEGRFQAGGTASKKSLPRGSRRKHEWVCGCKNSPG